MSFCGTTLHSNNERRSIFIVYSCRRNSTDRHGPAHKFSSLTLQLLEVRVLSALNVFETCLKRTDSFHVGSVHSELLNRLNITEMG
jgi:hypothetical protein